LKETLILVPMTHGPTPASVDVADLGVGNASIDFFRAAAGTEAAAMINPKSTSVVKKSLAQRLVSFPLGATQT
jgi:hypothetical protein